MGSIIVPIAIKGGPGSGNYGHAGRPGLVGGSADVGTMPYKAIPIYDKSAMYAIQKSAGPVCNIGDNKSVDYYIGKGYIQINETLRRNENPTNELQQHIQVLDGFTSSATLQDNVILYRGIKEGHEIANRFGTLQGSVIDDKGFVSTTLDELEGMNFAGARHQFGVIMEIQASAGTKCGMVGTEEYEVLLPRGSRFEVVKETIAQEPPDLGRPGYTKRTLTVRLLQ